MGSIVIALVLLLVCGPSVFKYLRDSSLVFSVTSHEVGVNTVKKKPKRSKIPYQNVTFFINFSIIYIIVQ